MTQTNTGARSGGMEEEKMAGWYIVETDDDGAQTLAHWICYPTEKACAEGIKKLSMPKWTGPLSARLHDGSVWK